MEQKYFELANTIVHNKFLKHSHWVTQATYPVTQETNKRRYATFMNSSGLRELIDVTIPVFLVVTPQQEGMYLK